jgi:hypothetical protein
VQLKFGRSGVVSATVIVAVAAIGLGCGRESWRQNCRTISEAGIDIGPDDSISIAIRQRAGRDVWPTSTSHAESIFSVKRIAQLATTQGLVTIARVSAIWASDYRPFVIACVSNESVLLLSGVKAPDFARLVAILPHQDLSDSATTIGVAIRLAELFDTNTGQQEVLGRDGSSSRGDASAAELSMFGCR